MSDYVSVESFKAQTECSYRGENYHVRDNGAIYRCARLGKRKRPLDEKWTFGTPSRSHGYMAISGHKVHRIVATAFLGDQPDTNYVVDHIDTNRRNNRLDNLRWVTRLENILLNPITASRIAYIYGSIEEFLADPRNPKNGDLSSDFEWMRSVSAEEAEESMKRMSTWAASAQGKTGGRIGEWVFNRNERKTPTEPDIEGANSTLVASKTPGAVQRNWKVSAEFPLCPAVDDPTPLQTYLSRLKKSELAVLTPWGETRVGEAVLTPNGREIFLLGEHEEDAIKPWSLSRITFECGQYVHESRGTFFTRDGAEKDFALAQGLPWVGGETIDDYC